MAIRIYDNGIYRDATAEELAAMSAPMDKDMELAMLHQQLADTDYKAIKYAEGELSEEDYAPIKEQRREWRRRINELESLLS